MEHNFGSESKNQRRFLLHKVFVENCIEYFAVKVKFLKEKLYFFDLTASAQGSKG